MFWKKTPEGAGRGKGGGWFPQEAKPSITCVLYSGIFHFGNKKKGISFRSSVPSAVDKPLSIFMTVFITWSFIIFFSDLKIFFLSIRFTKIIERRAYGRRKKVLDILLPWERKHFPLSFWIPCWKSNADDLVFKEKFLHHGEGILRVKMNQDFCVSDSAQHRFSI